MKCKRCGKFQTYQPPSVDKFVDDVLKWIRSYFKIRVKIPSRTEYCPLCRLDYLSEFLTKMAEVIGHICVHHPHACEGCSFYVNGRCTVPRCLR